MNDPSQESREAAGRSCGCVVMKFGGTSVEDAAAIRRLCQLVARPSAQPRVVVVSALARVTDQLMSAGEAAAAGHLDSAREMLQVLHQRHESVAGALVRDDECIRLLGEFAAEFTALDKLVRRIASDKALLPCDAGQFVGSGRIALVQTDSLRIAVVWSERRTGRCPGVHRDRRCPYPGHALVGRDQ